MVHGLVRLKNILRDISFKIYVLHCIYFALLTARKIKLNDCIKNMFDIAR